MTLFEKPVLYVRNSTMTLSKVQPKFLRCLSKNLELSLFLHTECSCRMWYISFQATSYYCLCHVFFIKRDVRLCISRDCKNVEKIKMSLLKLQPTNQVHFKNNFIQAYYNILNTSKRHISSMPASSTQVIFQIIFV